MPCSLGMHIRGQEREEGEGEVQSADQGAVRARVFGTKRRLAKQSTCLHPPRCDIQTGSPPVHPSFSPPPSPHTV